MATRKGKVKSAEFSCGSSGVGKSDACRKPWSFEVVLSEGGTHKKLKNAGVVQGSSTGKVIGLGAWCGGQKPLGLLGAAATRSCTKFNLTAQMRSRFRQEGQGAVSARKEERRSRHQISNGRFDKPDSDEAATGNQRQRTKMRNGTMKMHYSSKDLHAPVDVKWTRRTNTDCTHSHASSQAKNKRAGGYVSGKYNLDNGG